MPLQAIRISWGPVVVGPLRADVPMCTDMQWQGVKIRTFFFVADCVHVLVRLVW